MEIQRNKVDKNRVNFAMMPSQMIIPILVRLFLTKKLIACYCVSFGHA